MDGERSTRRRRVDALTVVLALAALLRLGAALHKGLVLDELHTWFHARAPDLATFFRHLRDDNHPPLGLLAVRAARALAGDAALALRAPALLFGLAEIFLVARIARRLGGVAPPVAAALLALSSLHVDFSSMARMYALLALAVTGLVHAVLALFDEEVDVGWAPWAAAGWTVVALHAHYYALHYVAAIGLVVVATGLRRPARRRRLARLVLPGTVALACSLPWYLWGFRYQLEHGLPPGGDDVDARSLGEALVHLFFLNVRLGGPALRVAFIGAGGLALGLGALGAARLATRRGAGGNARTAAPLLAVVAYGVPLLALGIAALRPRAGFTWHYVLPSAAALALLVAACAGPGRLAAARNVAVGAVGAAAGLLCVLNVASRGTEDYPGAVRSILERWRPGDAVVSVEWQPPVFPQGQPWDYYAPRLAAPEEAPERLPMNDAYDVLDPRAIGAHERIFLLRSSLPASTPLMLRLREHFTEETVVGWGFGLWVHLFESPRP